MSPRLKKRILFDLLLLSYLLFSYYALGGWWNSFAGFLLILLFARMLWKGEYLKRTGLGMNLPGFIFSVSAALLIICLSYLIIHYMAVNSGIRMQAGNWRDYFHEVFYILNEEIVLGAIILFYLTRTRNLNPVISCICLAGFFAVIHFIFYKWIFDDRGIISLLTLATLFFIGFLRNSLIIIAGHIGYSWALHLGWMTVMFGTLHSYTISGERLSELSRFNLYLGSAEMLTLAALLASVGLFLMVKKKIKVQF